MEMGKAQTLLNVSLLSARRVSKLIRNRSQAIQRSARCRGTVAASVQANFHVTQVARICTKTTTLTMRSHFIQETPRLSVAKMM
jgi:hypothetical protein